jgi:hypothetical protein
MTAKVVAKLILIVKANLAAVAQPGQCEALKPSRFSSDGKEVWWQLFQKRRRRREFKISHFFVFNYYFI